MKELTKAAAEQFEHSSVLGEVHLAESANPVTFRNAIEALARRGILGTADSEEGARERRYGPGPDFHELSPLRDRLAAALAAR